MLPKLLTAIDGVWRVNPRRLAGEVSAALETIVADADLRPRITSMIVEDFAADFEVAAV